MTGPEMEKDVWARGREMLAAVIRIPHISVTLPNKSFSLMSQSNLGQAALLTALAPKQNLRDGHLVMVIHFQQVSPDTKCRKDSMHTHTHTHPASHLWIWMKIFKYNASSNKRKMQHDPAEFICGVKERGSIYTGLAGTGWNGNILLCSTFCISSKHLYIIKSEIVALHFSNQQWRKSVKTLLSTEMHSVGVRNFWAHRTPGWVLFRTRHLRQGFSSPRKLRKGANNIKCKGPPARQTMFRAERERRYSPGLVCCRETKSLRFLSGALGGCFSQPSLLLGGVRQQFWSLD